MGRNQKGNTRAISLENVKNALIKMWNEYAPLMTRKELCGMINRVCVDSHVRKVALEDVLPFISNPAHEPDLEDAKKLKQIQKAKYYTAKVTDKTQTEEEHYAGVPVQESVEEVPTGIEFDGETMSSLYIAQETGKRHSHVLRDIRNLLGQGVNEANFVLVNYTDAKGEKRPCYKLTKKGSLLLVSGYNSVLREKIIDRWEELETGKAQPMAKMDALDIMTMQIQTLKDHRDRIVALEARIEQQERDRDEAFQLLIQLPEPTQQIPEKSTRSMVVQAARQYSVTTGVAFNEVFRQIYTEFKYIYHRDIMAIKRNGNFSTGLDVAEHYGWLDKLYAIAINLINKKRTV